MSSPSVPPGPPISLDPWREVRRAGAPPRFAVGCMNFGKRTSVVESERILARALDRGLTFFDTANAYNDGDSERILGRALRGLRDQCHIATKVGFGRASGKPEGLSRARILRAIDESLERLATDYVDVYYLHVPDRATPVEESIEAIAELLTAGKIRSWGISNYASWQILEMIHFCDAHRIARPVLSQQIYNLLIRQLDIEYFSFARRYPIHTTVYNPIAGGFLSGRRTRDTESMAGRFEGNKLYQRRYWTDRMFDLVDALKDVAATEGMTLLELAYAWLAARPGVDSILLGPATAEHLDAAIDACKKTVSPAGNARIDELYVGFQGTDATYAR